MKSIEVRTILGGRACKLQQFIVFQRFSERTLSIGLFAATATASALLQLVKLRQEKAAVALVFDDRREESRERGQEMAAGGGGSAAARREREREREKGLRLLDRYAGIKFRKS
jgi:hypothetical protein